MRKKQRNRKLIKVLRRLSQKTLGMQTIYVFRRSGRGCGKDIKYYVNGRGCWICTSHLTRNDNLSNRYPLMQIHSKRYQISHYVYEKYKGKIPKGKIVRHTCDNPKCINPEHLLIGTHFDNVQDMVKCNRQAKGERHSKAKLTEKEVIAIRINKELTNKELAEQYSVSLSTIKCIKNAETWKHLDGDIDNTTHTVKGEKHPDAKLTEKAVLEIRKSNVSKSELARKYGISRSTVCDIQTGRSWKHVGGNLREFANQQKLTDEDVVDIRRSALSDKVLAEKYGVDLSHINRIKNNKKRICKSI